MTTKTTKAGKECQICKGVTKLVNCHVCHGLGWLPQPGDALTAEEARKLVHTGNVEYMDFHENQWRKMDQWPGNMKLKDWRFRLAPAQEQPAEKGESVYETALKVFLNAHETDHDNPHYLFRIMVEMFISLTPEQIEALRKELLDN